jgi:XTP/dITP diphosphohydrolase
MKLVFATHNQNKFNEVKKLVPSYIELVSLTDIGCHDEIPETEETLEGNAKIKADYITRTYGLPCFADDTGLIVNALKGAPGVYSARYAGEHKSASDNMDKVLSELQDVENRNAQFQTSIALNLNKETIFFEGLVKGKITTSKSGKKGFGYDPIFQPEGYHKTFAELPLKIKNQISHRGRAVQKLVKYLHQYSPK